VDRLRPAITCFERHEMRDSWYPLATSEGVTKTGTRAVKLFGEPLVLFRDQSGQVVCLQDRCPHRSTPLSLGRVTEGRLECRYHGWQFGGGGKCLRIPSQPEDAAIPERATAVHRPCLERRGVVWVWAGQAEQADPALMPETPFAPLEAPEMASYACETAIDIPHELMLENLLDPAHVPFTHHGTLSRRSLAQPIRIEEVEGDAAMLSGRVRYRPSRNAFVPAMESVVLRFYPPCMAALEFFGWPSKRGRTPRTYQVHFCVPATRGVMVMFSFYGAPFPRSLQRWMKPMFQRMAAKVIGQDIAMLEGQHRALQQGGPEFQQAVAADRLTLQYRQWLAKNLTESVWFDGFCSATQKTKAEVPLRSVVDRAARLGGAG
jgi:phenylpropionate dioxygenase-like ring-hydroxylating dioxygenase large terminal subunit